jgi:predicted Zn-dependent peptidase
MSSINIPKLETFVYKNGLKHSHYYVPRLSTTNIAFFVNVGSADETEEKDFGAAHFLEHMVFNGSEKYPDRKELAHIVGKKMMYENAWTWASTTTYYLVAPNEEFLSAYNILYDRVFYPLLRKEDVDKERGIIIEELNMSRSRQESVLDMALTETLFKGTGYEHDTLGTLASLKGMSNEILKNFHEKNYNLSNVTLFTYGGASFEECKKVVQSQLDSKSTFLQRNPKLINKPELIKGRSQKIEFDTETPSYMFMSIMKDISSIEDYIGAVMLSTLLGSGDGSSLENALVYDENIVNSFTFDLLPFRDYLVLMFIAGVEESKTESLKTKFFKVLNDIRLGSFSDIEFTRAKNFLLGEIFMNLDDVFMPTDNSILSVPYMKAVCDFDLDYSLLYDKLKDYSSEDLKSYISSAFENYVNDKGWCDGFISKGK